MSLKSNSVLSGLITGIILPLLTFTILMLILKENLSLESFVRRAKDLHVLTKFLSISVVPNLLLFFLFLRRNFLLSARGVIGATLAEAFIIILLQVIL